MKTKNILIIIAVIIIFIIIIYFYARSMKNEISTSTAKDAFIKDCEEKRKLMKVSPGATLESCETLWNKTQNG